MSIFYAWGRLKQVGLPECWAVRCQPQNYIDVWKEGEIEG